jgi:hypothetical protein
MKVLVACEESGIVRDAFRAVGHDAWSCDLQPCSGEPEFHIQEDVMEVTGEPWDLIIAHPPCTYLANSGVRWLWNDDGTDNQERWHKVYEAKEFFSWFLMHTDHVPMVAIENPVPHRHAQLPPYTQCIQPWMFGDNFSKATCLWLDGLPPLVPTVRVKPREVKQACWLEPPGPNRQKNRSKTYPGIARAMAQQWGTDWVPALGLEP